MDDPTICDIFDQMDKDRHLAGVPLENRASPFFRQFLPDVLESCGRPINPLVIPEFPYKKAVANNRSPKVDFFVLSEDGEGAYFIELKTDMNSLDDDQAKYLNEAAQRGLRCILADIKVMAKHPKRPTRQKYFHMLQRLEDLKLIDMSPKLCTVMFDENPKGVYQLIDRIKIVSNDLKPEVIYIMPKRNANKKVITFKEFANVVEGRGDIGNRFARSLRSWAEVKAGSDKPR